MDTDQKENLNNVLNTNSDNKFRTKTLLKSVLFILLIMAFIKIVIVNENNEDSHKLVEDRKSSVINNIETEAVMKNENKIVKKIVPVYPSCPKPHLLKILYNICAKLFFKNEFCLPGDIHIENRKRHRKMGIFNNHYGIISPGNHRTKEAKVPAIINYMVGGLLILSVGAALVELYKAKKENPDKGNKQPLSRKCSLADLTVLKHHRKELIRRESIMEVPEDRENTRQLDFSPPPLLRRCSFPVPGPNARGVDRYGSVTADNRSVEPSRRISVIEEGTALAEDRKYSIVGDSRRTSMVDRRHSSNVDIRRVSVDDSPEKRHHRLVHRH